MTELVLTTFDWVPDAAHGFVKDLRVRWAMEEAGLAYRVQSTPSRDKGPEHFAHQPFGQVPWLSHGGTSIFESGAILLYLGGLSPVLMPAESRTQVMEWLVAALNSVEVASQPLSILKFSGDAGDSPAFKRFEEFLKSRLGHMETVLAGRQWLAGEFSAADIVMADVLRLVEHGGRLEDYPACRAYVARACARPAFVKAHADQIAHFAAAA